MKQISTRTGILVIVAVAVVLFGGAYTYLWYANPKFETLNPKQIKNSNIKNETADWKTYRNDEYGFEIKYPPNLKAVEDYNKAQGGPDIYFIDNKMNVSYLEIHIWGIGKNSEAGLIQLANAHFGQDIIDHFGIYYIGNHKVLQVYYKATPTNSNIIFSINKDFAYQVGGSNANSEIEAIIKKSISTFNFIK